VRARLRDELKERAEVHRAITRKPFARHLSLVTRHDLLSFRFRYPLKDILEDRIRVDALGLRIEVEQQSMPQGV